MPHQLDKLYLFCKSVGTQSNLGLEVRRVDEGDGELPRETGIHGALLRDGGIHEARHLMVQLTP